MTTATEPTTFTQEQVQAQIDAAVGQARAAFEQTLAEAEAANKTAELETQVTELQAQLDAIVVEKAQIEEAKAAVEKFWADAIVEHENTVVADARKDERLDKLKEVSPEGAHAYLEANADRFAAMSDDDFAARIEEYTTIAAKDDGTPIPTTTALTAARESAGGKAAGSMLSELPNLRTALSDPRTL